MAAAFEHWRAAGDELARVRKAVAERDARQELVAFQFAEIDRAAIVDAGEDVELAARRQVLANAERVERLCEESYASLYEDDGAVLANLGGVWRRVAELAALDPAFPALRRRPGRDQVAARRSGALPAPVRGRNRGVARQASAGGGAPGAARTSETQVRPDARRHCRAP